MGIGLPVFYCTCYYEYVYDIDPRILAGTSKTVQMRPSPRGNPRLSGPCPRVTHLLPQYTHAVKVSCCRTWRIVPFERVYRHRSKHPASKFPVQARRQRKQSHVKFNTGDCPRGKPLLLGLFNPETASPLRRSQFSSNSCILAKARDHIPACWSPNELTGFKLEIFV